MQLTARALQSRPIKSTERPRADDGVTSLHIPEFSKAQFVLLCLRSVMLEEPSVPYPKILRVRTLLTHGVCAAVCVGVDGGGGEGRPRVAGMADISADPGGDGVQIGRASCRERG